MSEDVPEIVALLHVLADMELIPAQLREPMPLPQLEQQVVAALQARHASGPAARHAGRGAADRRGGSRPAVERHVAHPQSAAAGLTPAARPRPVRRGARASQSDDHRPGGLQRDGRREHDARPRLAIPRHRPPPRTVDSHDAAGAQRDRGQPVACRHPRAAARSGRQLDDLPPPLLRRAAAAASARSAARRRDQPAGPAVPARHDVRPAVASAAPSAGAVADPRGADRRSRD